MLKKQPKLFNQTYRKQFDHNIGKKERKKERMEELFEMGTRHHHTHTQ